MTARPDLSIGELMDARDRRERRRAWRMVLWPAFLSGMTWLVVMPIRLEVAALPRIVAMRVQEPARDEVLELLPNPVCRGGLHFARSCSVKLLARPEPGQDERERLPGISLVDLDAGTLVGRYHCDSYQGFLLLSTSAERSPARSGRLLTAFSREPRSLFYPEGVTSPFLYRLYEAVLDPPLDVSEFDPLSGAFTGLGGIPFNGWIESIREEDERAICARFGSEQAPFGPPARRPLFKWGGQFPTRVLVSLRDRGILREVPIPGHCYFLSGDAALCFSPYGLERVDLATGVHQPIPLPTGIPRVLKPEQLMVYRHDGGNCLGFLHYKNWSEPPLVLRIELTDPPRVERLDLSISGLTEVHPGSTESGEWQLISEINFERKLLIAHDRYRWSGDHPSWYLVDGVSGRVLLHQEAAGEEKLKFIGTDHLRTSRAIVFPELLGPIRPDTPSAADSYTTQTLHVADCLKLDEILPPGSGR